MKKFVASKLAVAQLKQEADKLSGQTGKVHGVAAVFENQYLTVLEIRWAEPDAMSLRYIPDAGKPNVVIIGEGNEFSADVVLGHATGFLGV